MTDFNRVFRIRDIQDPKPLHIIGLLHYIAPNVKTVINRIGWAKIFAGQDRIFKVTDIKDEGTDGFNHFGGFIPVSIRKLIYPADKSGN